MSRSVTMPIGRRAIRSPTTGIAPQSHCTIIRATAASEASGRQHCGSLVITSRTRMVGSLPAERLRSTWAEHDAIAGPERGVVAIREDAALAIVEPDHGLERAGLVRALAERRAGT